MNADLQHKVEEVLKRSDVTYMTQGDFTVALLKRKKDGFVFAVGVTKRNPGCDDDNPERAQKISLDRAVKNASSTHPKRTTAGDIVMSHKDDPSVLERLGLKRLKVL